VLSIYSRTKVHGNASLRAIIRTQGSKMNSIRRPAFPNLLAQLFLISILSSHVLLAADPAAAKSAHPAPAAELVLGDHWTLQTSAKVEAKGETISTTAFIPKGWHTVTVPTTVVSALVKDKTLPTRSSPQTCASSPV